jgi:hypothetical protein
LQELEPQAALEKLFGLSCRCLPGIDAESRSEFQLQFVQYQIMPFWACVSKLWPELRHACIQLERNLQVIFFSLAHLVRALDSRRKAQLNETKQNQTKQNQKKQN